MRHFQVIEDKRFEHEFIFGDRDDVYFCPRETADDLTWEHRARIDELRAEHRISARELREATSTWH